MERVRTIEVIDRLARTPSARAERRFVAGGAGSSLARFAAAARGAEVMRGPVEGLPAFRAPEAPRGPQGF